MKIKKKANTWQNQQFKGFAVTVSNYSKYQNFAKSLIINFTTHIYLQVNTYICYTIYNIILFI